MGEMPTDQIERDEEVVPPGRTHNDKTGIQAQATAYPGKKLVAGSKTVGETGRRGNGAHQKTDDEPEHGFFPVGSGHWLVEVDRRVDEALGRVAERVLGHGVKGCGVAGKMAVGLQAKTMNCSWRLSSGNRAFQPPRGRETRFERVAGASAGCGVKTTRRDGDLAPSIYIHTSWVGGRGGGY